MRTQPEIIIQRLEADNSRLAKEAIINSAMNEGLDEFFEGLRLCYDSLCTFGVKQVPTKTDNTGQGLPWSGFLGLAQKLRSRQLSGHDARDAIELAMSVATQSQWNDFYRRILIKDMRAGFSETTINKVVSKKRPDYVVPVFSCQLAHDSANHETKVAGNKLIEVKLDGCLSEDWVVEFDTGVKVTIKEVVDSRLKGKIKSFNPITNEIEFNNIIEWAVDGTNDEIDEYEWFVITLENGITLPPLTGNHLIYLPELKCYQRADSLKEDDVVLVHV